MKVLRILGDQEEKRDNMTLMIMRLRFQSLKGNFIQMNSLNGFTMLKESLITTKSLRK